MIKSRFVVKARKATLEDVQVFSCPPLLFFVVTTIDVHPFGWTSAWTYNALLKHYIQVGILFSGESFKKSYKFIH
jgi:hypothetical protein